MLTTEAFAQTAEATSAATKAVDGLLNNGVLGLLCLILLLGLVVAGLVVRHLYNDLKAINAKTIEDRERLIKAVEGFTDAMEGVEAALQGVRSTLETRAQAIVELSHQFEIIATELRHGLNNLSQAVEGVARWLRPDRSGGGP